MNRSLKLVTISIFAWGVGEGMFLLFQPIYLLKLGADPIWIGAVLGGMGFMTTIAQIPSGYLSDRFGMRPIMWISWIWGTLAAWFMALSNSLPLFVVGLLLYGLTGSVMAPMNAYITAMRGKWSAERALTFTSAAYHLGTVIGPTLGGFLGQKYDLKLLYLIAAILFIISTALILGIKKPSIEIHHDPGSSSEIIHNRIFLRLVTLGFITIFFMLFAQSLTPIYLETTHQLNLQEIGLLGTIGSFGNVALALAAGSLPARIGFLIGIPATLLFPLLLWQGKNFSMFGAAYFFFGGYRLSRSMLLALTRKFVASKNLGFAYGVMETANGLALILAPALSGLVYNQNQNAMFIISIVGLFIIFIVNLFVLPSNPGRSV
ncbi:MAG: hypothetical protein CVU39_01975 [Chloroflexi bacterium HGW-Chloroflexi-10]|nr:MAG: hypothetical protein CVU39_01975 [Chloroflexi bacterium HGW-Chloroflexi-10]